MFVFWYSGVFEDPYTLIDIGYLDLAKTVEALKGWKNPVAIAEGFSDNFFEFQGNFAIPVEEFLYPYEFFPVLENVDYEDEDLSRHLNMDRVSKWLFASDFLKKKWESRPENERDMYEPFVLKAWENLST